MIKSEKGTPQYDIWLAKFRAKRGTSSHPVDSKLIAKLEGSEDLSAPELSLLAFRGLTSQGLSLSKLKNTLQLSDSAFNKLASNIKSHEPQIKRLLLDLKFYKLVLSNPSQFDASRKIQYSPNNFSRTFGFKHSVYF